MLESFRVHASEICLDDISAFMGFVGPVSGGELRGDDHFISTIALGHPLSNPGLRLFILIVARCVDEVTTSGESESAN